MRKLAILSLAFSTAVFLACYLIPLDWLSAVALILTGIGLPVVLFCSRWRRAFMLAWLGALCGLTLFFCHAQRTSVPASELDGETRNIRAVVISWPVEYDTYTRVEIRLETEGLPRLTALLYDNEKALSGTEPGQWIEGEVRLRPADTRYGEEYTAYNARDVYLIASSRGTMQQGKRSFMLSLLPMRINRQILKLVNDLFPKDTVAFFQALMLGDKTQLYLDKGRHLALSRAGLMHVVAVSGMHIAFIIGLLQTVFGKTRLSSLLSIALVWLFVLITGAGPSAVRAGLMQTMLLLAPLFGRENDELTSLSFALGILLLLNPFAAASVSLQLSFASLAGILCFAGRLSEKVYDSLPALRDGWLGRTMVGAVVNSLSVMPFTIPLMAVHFGYVSILSPLTNLLCLWAVSLCFSGAYFTCAAGLVFRPLGVFAARLLAWPARWILLSADLISSVPFSVAYLEKTEIVMWLSFVYLLFAVSHFLPLRRLLRFLIPAGIAAVSLAVILVSIRLDYESGPGTIGVLDVGQGQCICVMSGQHTVLIDCGGTGALQNAGETAGRYLISRGRKTVDALLLTHLDSDHTNGVTMLMEYVPVGTVLLCAGQDPENSNLSEIAAAAEAHGTHILFLEQDSALTLGSLYAELYTPSEGVKGNDGCLCMVFSLGEYQMLVTGDVSATAEQKLLQRYPLSNLELLVAGHHGSRYSNSERLLRRIGAHTAVVSCGYNTYGHPAQETLERFSSLGYTVMRTDTDGTVEIRVEE